MQTFRLVEQAVQAEVVLLLLEQLPQAARQQLPQPKATLAVMAMQGLQ